MRYLAVRLRDVGDTHRVAAFSAGGSYGARVWARRLTTGDYLPGSLSWGLKEYFMRRDGFTPDSWCVIECPPSPPRPPRAEGWGTVTGRWRVSTTYTNFGSWSIDRETSRG